MRVRVIRIVSNSALPHPDRLGVIAAQVVGNKKCIEREYPERIAWAEPKRGQQRFLCLGRVATERKSTPLGQMGTEVVRIDRDRMVCQLQGSFVVGMEAGYPRHHPARTGVVGI